jgi:fibrillarin-like pre-rRNA processing protein
MEETIQQWKNLDSVYDLDGHLATLQPNSRKTGVCEKLVEIHGNEYRLWNPRRSKLAAAILNGLETFPSMITPGYIYLGASTAQPIPYFDICSDV